MLQKIKHKLLALASILTFAAPMAVPAVAVAQVTPTDIRQGLCGGTGFQLNKTECPTAEPGGGFEDKLRQAVNILSAIIGIIAVIMIIFGGFKYITSGGAQDRVKSAKDTLLYAIIGLIIVALAQIIVRFVLRSTTTT